MSRLAVQPLRVDAVGDLLDALIASEIELRITPSLRELWERIVASTLRFSGTRLRNARA